MASSSLSQTWEHDVFPSFHGKDVRQTFLSHVLKEFSRKGINSFIDNEIKRGEFIGLELKRAIKGSKIAIVLLSKNYASSSWCLDELVEIMKKQLGQKVITIFYEIDPTDIKKQKGDFGKVFKKTCKGKGKEKVRTWRKALEGVATIAGYHSSNWDNETTMIENIAADISNKLNLLTPSHDFDHLIGMGAHMERMKLLLHLDLDEVRMIGIWGPPGIGKTTIARFLFNQVSNSFQNSAFMVNIKGSYPRPCLDEYSAQLQLQKEMLSTMINQKDIIVSHLGVAEGRLRRRTVLLVLDEVDRLAQLDALAKNVQWFGPGSRIIITTEDLRLLEAHRIDHIYKVNFPSTDEALQMFCMYAFDQKYPKDGFDVLAREITYLVGELPLALKVMGSYFRGLSKHQWSMEVSRLRTNLNGEIESILKFSFDALCDEDKDLFLHIANYFNNEYMERVEEYLAESFKNVRQRIHVLTKKSLIYIDHMYIRMHNLLVQLGKEIVRKQSVREPGKRQFLVDEKDICEILTDYTTITRSVIGLDSNYELNINITEEALKKLPNLQFLRIRYDFGHPNIISSPGSLNYISPKLRILDWSYLSMTCLPFTNNLEFLVELSMYKSKLEKLWDGIKLLRNLKRVNLSYSRNLKEFPNLSTATSLKQLDLKECSSLVELPFSIGNATNIEDLDLSGCSSLVELPFSIGNATNLDRLALSDCSSLVELPSSIGNLHKLKTLYMQRCSSLVELPFSIGNATNLKSLDLSGCSSLVELPFSIGNATNLDRLALSDCSSLVELPSSIGNLHKLKTLYMQRCSSLVELPFSIGNATNLKSLDLSGCSSLVELPFSIGNATNLDRLGLSDCSSLAELPFSIGNLHKLKALYMQRCSSLVELPFSIGNLNNLETLHLGGCSKLKALPIKINMESLDSLDLNDCWSLKSFPEISTNIAYLNLVGTSIKEVPRSIRSSSYLYDLRISYSENLKEFPYIHNIITELHLSDTGIQELGPWVRGFSSLYRLVVKGMQKLVSLPQLPDSLRSLDAGNCVSLEKLDCSFCNPDIILNFRNCFKLNQEARDLIIERSTLERTVLPGGEVPACFTYRASGSSVTVKLNQQPRRTSVKFKACFLFVNNGENEAYERGDMSVSWSMITSKEDSLAARGSFAPNLIPILTEHLYIFEFVAEGVTSTELIFEFESTSNSRNKAWEIKECGIIHLLEHNVDGNEEMC